MRLIKLIIAIIIIALSFICINSNVSILIIIGMLLDILGLFILCSDKSNSTIKKILRIE